MVRVNFNSLSKTTLWIISINFHLLQQTMFVYVLNQRSNTKCKTENYHTAVLHWTNQSHISDNARKPCHRVNSLIGEDRQYKINFREQP